MSDKMTLAEFGQMVKAKHPDYASYSDEEIGQRVLQKYPEYADRVDSEPKVDMNHIVAPPTAGPAAPSVTDNRSAMEVGVDQAVNVGKGVLGAVTGIPGMLRKVAGVGYDSLTGNAQGAVGGAKDLVSGAVHGIVDPIATSVRGAAAYAAPDSVKAPSRQDWETAAQDAGGQLGGALVGKVLHSIPTDAEGIQGIANKLRSIKQAQGPAGIPLTATQATGAAIRGVAGAAVEPIASVAERLARARASMDAAPAVADTAAAPMRTAEPNAPVQDLQQQIQREGVANNRPNMEMRQPGTPSAPLPASPELQQLQQQMGSQGTPDMEMRQPSTPSAPLPASPELQQLQQQMGSQGTPDMEMRQPGAPSAPLPASPELQQLQQQMSKPVAHPDAGTAAPRDIQMAREAILKDGTSRSTANLLKVSRNVPELLNTAPELRGVPPGPNFNAKLFGAFNRIGHDLKATEASIPDTTMVPTEDAVTKLKSLEAKYLDTNQPAAVRAIDKVKSFLADRPSMKWSDFIQAKRAFFNEISLSSAAGREAYQIFKKLSNDVSPELGDLNQKYYTVKSAMENAAMDVKNGEKIRSIGKPQKPVGYTEDAGGRPLRAPL